MEHEYSEGQKVKYKGSFGNGKIEIVTILSADDEKNDRPVYDLDNGHWCYEDQII